ncbi:MAG: hypothetical protein EBQ96_07415, partial [Proteobacteria bacterium]|nr:hypothetical protein [Pseudomonadota bacterium]
MFQSVNQMGHKVSAFAGSVLHSREQRTVKARALVVGTLFSGVFLLSTTNMAMAQQTLQQYSTDVSGRTNIIVDIVSYICYIGGAILSALGIVRRKPKPD